MAESRKINLLLIQMHVDAGDPDSNFTRVAEKLDEAAAQSPKPDVMVLPEMWNTGFALDTVQDTADVNGKRTKALLSSAAKQHHVVIIGGSIAEKRGDQVYNTSYVFDRSGELIHSYSKAHLFRLMDEEKHLAQGGDVGAFSLEGTPAGVNICYDLRFPELARKLAVGGAMIMFLPAEWPHPRLHHWRSLAIARAIENQMFIVTCNRIGSSLNTEFFGHSMVVDPWGEILAEGGESNQLIAASIDLKLASEVRQKIPVFQDRRTDLY